MYFFQAYLHPGLGEADAQRQLLPHEDVRVVRLGEAPLQLVQLRRREARPVPLLLLVLALLYSSTSSSSTSSTSSTTSSSITTLVVVVVVIVVVVVVVVLLLLIPLRVVHLDAADLVPHRGSLHVAVRAGGALLAVRAGGPQEVAGYPHTQPHSHPHASTSTSAETTLQSLPVAEQLRRRVLHPCEGSEAVWLHELVGLRRA